VTAAERLARLRSRAGAAGRWLVSDIRGHWPSAAFSIVVAFGVWLLFEDESDPRVEARAPENAGIPVVAVNVPDGYLEPTLGTVVVRVRGRESDLQGLRPDDFRATVDLSDVEPGAEIVSLPVRVAARRDGVEVVEVIPGQVDVRFDPAAVRQLQVTARVIDPPPAGFQIREVDGKPVPPDISPAIVTVQGEREIVDRVARVEFDVSLANARTGEWPTSGELVARSEDGNVLQVRLSTTRAQATYQIEAVFAPLTLGVQSELTGEPARGFYVVRVTFDPPTVELTGPQAVIEGLRGPLLLAPIDVSNQTRTFTQTRTVQPPENVEVGTQTILVTVQIEPVHAEKTIFAAVTVTDVPEGLAVSPGQSITTQMVVAGNLLDVDALVLNPSLLQATVSLSGATAGTASYTPVVVPPANIEVKSVSQVSVTLVESGP
jgi:YbbR domain-containing protein